MQKILAPFFLIIALFFNQNVRSQTWFNKIWYTKKIQFVNSENYPEMMLGNPTVYPLDKSIKDVNFDLYTEGYILLPGKKTKTEIAFQPEKPLIADAILLGGVYSQGVIKKVSILLKNQSWQTVYQYSKSSLSSGKQKNMILPFTAETVYGVLISIDHSKVENWNVMKGIGLGKGATQKVFEPNLFTDSLRFSEKQNLGGNVNSSCADFNPKISQDGQILFFVRYCEDEPDQEIFYTEIIQHEVWSKASNIGSTLNNMKDNYVIATNPDGSEVWLGNAYDDKVKTGLAKSIKTGGSWSDPEVVKLPNVENTGEFINYYISPDQQVLILSLEGENTIGKQDLYAMIYNPYRKTWDSPIHMGKTINTPFSEDFPFLSKDKKTLFYSSNGFVGYGAYDVYMSKRLDNTWTNWSKPINLGPMLNTKTDDFGFFISGDGQKAYYSSLNLEDTTKGIDLYRITLPDTLKQDPVVVLKGRVTSLRNNKKIPVSVRYKTTDAPETQWKTASSPATGAFVFAVDYGKVYDVRLESPGHFRLTDTLHVMRKRFPHVILKNYSLQPYMDSGQVSIIDNLLFDFGTARIRDSSYITLDKMVVMLREQNQTVLQISGHTDDIGSEEFNQKLSEDRAKSVVSYLISKGIRPWRLKSKGMGESAPLAPNDTEEGRRMNRRVEILVLEDDFGKKYKKEQKSKYKNREKYSILDKSSHYFIKN